MKIDHAKELNEKLYEQAAGILAHTIPEQKVDAMKDYFKVLRVLAKINDWRIQPIREKINLLYMYPSRRLHNKVVVELNDLLEETREKRINVMIEKQRALGNFESANDSYRWPPLVIIAIVSIWMLWR